jgi:riboflavin biosynthesis pyrimidine reductase
MSGAVAARVNVDPTPHDALRTEPLSAALPRLQPLTPDLQPGGVRLRGLEMPAALEGAYGGPLVVPLRPDRPTIVANFASTLDGVVAFGPGPLTGGGLISGFHGPDRFVMGLLRALADVIVVGAGTLRGSTRQRWTAEHIYPAAASQYAAWRDAMGLVARPATVIVTAGGDIPADHPALNDPTIPVTIASTRAGADRLRTLPLATHVSIESIGTEATLTGEDILATAACRGARLVLYEGGPHLLAEIVRADLLDELFLTLAPQLAGRDEERRPGLIEGLALTPSEGRWHELVSVRRSDSHLFLRYRRSDRPPLKES